MSAGASPAIGPPGAAGLHRVAVEGWQGQVAVEGWHGQVAVEGWQASELSWRERPVLRDGELHIWSADLQSSPPTSVLSAEELERARRVIRPRARRRWLAARVFLRTLLASYVAEDPSSLRFALEGRGKPVLAERSRGELHFNLSHSGPLAVCALSRRCSVGVDVQLMPRERSARRLEARLLGDLHTAQLDRLGATEARRRVLRAWVGLEAERKRTGLGLGGAGAHFSCPRPWLAQLDLADAGAGAVALAQPPCALSLGRWSYFRISDLF